MKSETHQGMLVITNLEQLLDKVYSNLRNFPKYEKFTLSQIIRNNLLESISLMQQSLKVKSKRIIYAQEADAKLSTLMVNYRLAYTQRYITQGYFMDISIILSNISNLISSYIKNCVSTNKKNN